MAGAAYGYDDTFRDDETFEFSWQLGDTPFADYAHEYVLARHGAEVFRLSVGAGIALDQAQELVTFAKHDARLSPGDYELGYRIRHLETGHVIPVFDGVLTITK